MPTPIYTYTNFKDHVLDPIKYANLASEYTVLNCLNRAVRGVLSDLDLRSTKRRSGLSPNLFDEEYDYSRPTDLKGLAICDVVPHADRPSDLEWELVSPEEFDRRKTLDRALIAFQDFDSVAKLRLTLDDDLDQLVISSLDSLTDGGGTWVLFGDGTNLVADTDDYVKGTGSIRWDISAAGGTTAGIQNTGLTSFDFSDYVDLNRSVFVWAYVVSATNLTNYILRLGSSSSNYYSITASTTNEGTAFRAGWNLLRFDFANKATTGSPNSSAGTYAAIYMTKTSGKVSETGYRFDQVIAQEGRPYDVYYYSKYGWQTSAGVWIENSTTSTDLLNADTDEFDLFVLRAKIELKNDVPTFQLDKEAPVRYAHAVKAYGLTHPSDAKVFTQILYRFNA